jgi:3'-phosphoadenosine 5'-phosphosulfate sulfotransferase (PAPS reductase)/FAD synthetase
MSTLLEQLETKALGSIESFLPDHPNSLLAYSGGKDGLVVSHLVNRVAPIPGVCETSFYFDKQEEDIRATAERLGIKVVYRDSLDFDWLRRHPDFLFSDSSSIRSRTFAIRQQSTVAREVRRGSYTAAIYGRRTEENTVKAERYTAKGFEQFHPIREWKTSHIWEYIEKHKIGIPWFYTTPLNDKMGNGPFISLRASAAGGKEAAWELVESLDKRFTPAIMENSKH